MSTEQKLNYVDSVEIEGFWGTKQVSLKLNEDTNFLIGPNGSGKTTIINLISGALKADFPSLYDIQFDKITVRLKAIGDNRKPVIEVKKSVNKEMGRIEFKYTIHEKTSGKGMTHVVNGVYDGRVYRDFWQERRPYSRVEEFRIGRILSKLVEVSSLSIHRTNLETHRRYQRDESFESTVDRKIYELSGLFSKYFSLLASRAEAESKNFQERVFLSLLNHNHSGSDVFREYPAEDEDESTVVDVLTGLGVSRFNAKKSVNAHFKKLAVAKKKLATTKKNGDKNAINVDDAIVISDNIRGRELIKEWTNMQMKHNTIFQPKNKFEEIINNLFSRKKIQFDERNTPRIRLESGKEVDVNVLSSGEKQMFILLGETLLQEKKPVVFISDEPELSLHVEWQNSLFKNVRQLNEKCQIITATHSPDIVGSFQNHIIRVEDCVNDIH